MLTTSIVNERREWRTELTTCSFQFSPKTRQTMPLYAYLTPKIDFKRKFNHHQSFLYEWRWQRGRFENFESDHHYESNLESDVRFEIESNHEASQVPNFWTCLHHAYTVLSLCSYRHPRLRNDLCIVEFNAQPDTIYSVGLGVKLYSLTPIVTCESSTSAKIAAWPWSV